MRIEGLLAAFPKLVAGIASSGGGRQHTYVETDTVRYLYQPLEVTRLEYGVGMERKKERERERKRRGKH